MTKIKEFRGDNYYLSNFYDAPVMFEGIMYLNNEAAFQAAKLKDNQTRCPKTRLMRKDFSTMPPNIAKRNGRRITLRADWETVKDSVMAAVVNDKFTRNTKLQDKLIATGDTELFEGNSWNDRYWGVDIKTGAGKNTLGQILMAERNNLKGGI